jgi:tRNA threonylcarbamoyladenosine biosynthesis protein TsaE
VALTGFAVTGTPAIPDAPAVVTEPELQAYGRALGAALRAPVVVALHGDLGAGKTTTIQAIVRGAGANDDVTSPTYALVHEYRVGAVPLYHIDLYRLANPSELTNIGWDDIIGADAIVLVEWPERAGTRLPRERLDIRLDEVPDREDQRALRVTWAT